MPIYARKSIFKFGPGFQEGGSPFRKVVLRFFLFVALFIFLFLPHAFGSLQVALGLSLIEFAGAARCGRHQCRREPFGGRPDVGFNMR